MEVVKVFGMTGMIGKVVGYDNRSQEYIVRMDSLQLLYRYKEEEIRLLTED